MDSIFTECFGSIEDPRVERTKKHLLPDIIALGICGVISGAQSWEEIEDFGTEHQNWFSCFLCLPNGIPSHDTISRVFSMLDNAELQKSSLNWLKKLKDLMPETVIPIDGKTLRKSGCKSKCQKALHIINVWSCANGISLGQLKVDGKSNEITAVPEILKQLVLEGAIVTLDAMGCQEETVRLISEANADYVIALKGNQGKLHGQVKSIFDSLDKNNDSFIFHEADDKVNADHGRIEQRKIQTVSTQQLEGVFDDRWTSLNSIVRIIYSREERGSTLTEKRFYISSISASNPEQILKAIRSHWNIENCLHWSLDISFKEDESRIRDENAALNMSWLRKFSLGLLKNEKSFKGSIRRKQRKVCANPEYFKKIFGKN